MILRARTLMPVASPPLDDGAVGICDGRIVAVGRFREVARIAGGTLVDFGEVVLMPGLVNAHCHLDYTSMGGHIPPTSSFTEWIKAITGLKGSWGYTEFAESWIRGARMLLRTGTTTVGDIEAIPELPGDVWPCTPLRVHSYFEMTGVRSRKKPELILRETLEATRTLPLSGRHGVGLSPHALYSTPPQLLPLALQHARSTRTRVAIHLAESVEEYQMFTESGGAMFDWLRRNGRDMGDCGGRSPVQRLAELGVLGPELVAVHVNYLRNSDARRLSEARVNVVHCPRSHAFFEHLPFPYEELTSAGVNVSLGTDSLATTRRSGREPLQLDMFAEMRLFASRHPGVAAEKIVAMATAHGAWALGLGATLGTLQPGLAADLIAVPFRGIPLGAAEAVVHHSGALRASMIAGQWALEPV
jgi:cytosine/adenosine deaminase-related metal-dependent hydrolase